MNRSNLEYVTAWVVGGGLAFGVATALCKRTRVFAASPAYAAQLLVHSVYVFAICYYSLIGPLDWIWKQPATLQERMYMYDPAAERICLLQIALQIYSIVTALLTQHPLLMKPEGFVHHIMTGFSMVVALHPFGHPRANLFFGITELSTIPLDVIDLFKGFKELRKQCPTTDIVCKALFALSFLGLRVGLVTQASVGFQRDLYQLYMTGTAHSLPVVAFSSLSNILIVCLQLYWSTLIIKGMQKTLAGGGGKGGKAS